MYIYIYIYITDLQLNQYLLECLKSRMHQIEYTFPNEFREGGGDFCAVILFSFKLLGVSLSRRYRRA